MDTRLFDSLSDAIIAIDEEKKVVYGNAAAAELAGVPTSRLRKKIGLEELFEPAVLSNVQFNDAPSGFAGNARWLLHLSTSKQREKIVETSKMSVVGEFVASISHELNNPLAIVINSIETLLPCLDDETPDLPLIKELAGYIHVSCQRIGKLSQHLKSLGRNSLSAQDVVESSPRQIMENAVQFTNHLTCKAGITVSNKVPNDLPAFTVDPAMIEQLAINLIRNAYDELRPTGTGQIELSGRYDPATHRFLLQVSDTGPGIAPHIAAQLFKPFTTTKSAGLGTGLGLSICTQIAEMHEGSLTLAPSAAGACFELALPLKPSPAQAQDVRVLVAHPSAWLRSMLVRALTPLCLPTPQEIFTDAEGLKQLATSSWDLLLIDEQLATTPALAELGRTVRPEKIVRIVEGSDRPSTSAITLPRAFTKALLAARVAAALG